MKSRAGNAFNIGRRLTLTLALLIALILGGNGLVILQFAKAHLQADRLIGVSQQLIAVLRLHESLLSFHRRLNDLAESKDAPRLIREAQPLHTALLEQAKEARRTLAYLPAEFRVDPAFLTALNTIEITLPLQLQDISTLAAVGDWDVIRIHLDDELQRIETTTSAHVNNINRDLDEELPVAVANMKDVRRRILVIVPATAISTVLIAVFFGWSVARRLMELRLEERVGERTRIARDLHDTLLQSFQGVLFKVSMVPHLIRDRPADAQVALERAIEQARQAVTEGRDAVQALRSSTVDTVDIAQAIATFGEELVDTNGNQAPDFQVHVEGTPRYLVPVVRDEAYRIAGEALRNSFKYSGARRVQVDIHYDQRELRLTVRDNGKGIDRDVLDAGARSGHFGLLGMRERARLVGGKLAIRSELDSGTEIELTVSAVVAYAKEPAARRAADN